MSHHGAAAAVDLGALSRPSSRHRRLAGRASEIPPPALSVLPRLIRPGVIYAAMLLLLKLTLAPLLVATATLIARRWGPKVAGVLIGFPVLTGPIFVFLVIDQGLDFAERSIVGILFGLVGLAAFALAYALVSRRTGWFGLWSLPPAWLSSSWSPRARAGSTPASSKRRLPLMQPSWRLCC